MDVNKTLIYLLKQFKELNEKYDRLNSNIELILKAIPSIETPASEDEEDIPSQQNSGEYVFEKEPYVAPEITDYGTILYMPKDNVRANLGNASKFTIRFKDKIYNDFSSLFYTANPNNDKAHKHLIFDLNTDGLENAGDTPNINGLYNCVTNIESLSFTKNHNYVFSCDSTFIFNGFTNLQELNFYWFDFTKAKDVCIWRCPKLTTIKNLYCPNLRSLYSIFDGDESLTDINLKNINTNVTSLDIKNPFDAAFRNCKKIKEIDLSHIKFTSDMFMKGLAISEMFYNCLELEYIDISNIDLSLCESYSNMFYNCPKLKKIVGLLDFSNITTSNQYRYKNMFYNCTSLSDVKIKNPPSDFFSVSGLKKEQCTIINE